MFKGGLSVYEPGPHRRKNDMSLRERSFMKLLVATALTAVLLGAAGSPAAAQTREPSQAMIHGQKLLDWCNSREQHRRFSCGYYVMGAIDMLVNGELLQGRKDGPYAVCPPPGKTPEELVTMVKHYIESHKDQRDKPGYEIVYAAMREAFPCK